jgi:hypothetical protein
MRAPIPVSLYKAQRGEGSHPRISAANTQGEVTSGGSHSRLCDGLSKSSRHSLVTYFPEGSDSATFAAKQDKGRGGSLGLGLLTRNEKEALMRSELRLSDLKKREYSSSRLMNVKIPAYVSDAIQKVADDLGASKTEVVIALLNEGLEVAVNSLKGLQLNKGKTAAKRASK